MRNYKKRDYKAARILHLGLEIVGREPAIKLVENRPLHKIKPMKLVKPMQASLFKREAPSERLGQLTSQSLIIVHYDKK